MKLRDYSEVFLKDWLQQLLQWSRGRVSFQDNIEGQLLVVNYINTSETEIGHNLGRVPLFVMSVSQFPHAQRPVEPTKAPTIDKLYLKTSSAGSTVLFLA